MANEEEVHKLRDSTYEEWNQWRRDHPVFPDFRGADLSDLSAWANERSCGYDLSHALFDGANLEGANLVRANLEEASFEGANLRGASLGAAHLVNARLTNVNFNRTDIDGTEQEGLVLTPTHVTCLVCDRQEATVDRARGESWALTCPACGSYAMAPDDIMPMLTERDAFKPWHVCKATSTTEALDYRTVIKGRSEAQPLVACRLCTLCENWACASAEDGAERWICRVCGPYALPSGGSDLEGLSEAERHQLTWALRRAFDRGLSTDVLTLATTRKLLADVTPPRQPIDSVNDLLMWIHERTGPGGEFVELEKWDYPIARATGIVPFDYLVELGGRLGWLETPEDVPFEGPSSWTNKLRYRLTVEGWKQVLHLQRVRTDNRQVFVAMSFAPEFAGAWLGGLAPGVRDADLDPLRVDEIHHGQKICDRLVAEIRRSRLVIADCSEGSGNVYFEAGFAMGLGIPVVWTCRKQDQEHLQFDTRQYPHILWEDPEDLRRQVGDRLRATVVVVEPPLTPTS